MEIILPFRLQCTLVYVLGQPKKTTGHFNHRGFVTNIYTVERCEEHGCEWWNSRNEKVEPKHHDCVPKFEFTYAVEKCMHY